jgi:hypothetical protein
MASYIFTYAADAAAPKAALGRKSGRALAANFGHL